MASMKNPHTQEYPIQVLREKLRRQANQQAAQLSRSVDRLTSYDVQPCPEYRQEVVAEYAVIDRLLYAQNCRSSLERCIASGSARLCYRWQDSRTTETRFRRTAPGRIKVSGLQSGTA